MNIIEINYQTLAIFERERVIRIIDKILRKLNTEESNKYAEIFEKLLNKVEWKKVKDICEIL